MDGVLGSWEASHVAQAISIGRAGTRRSMAASVVRVNVTCLLLAHGAAGSSQEDEVVEVVEMSASAGWPIQWLLTVLVGRWCLAGLCKVQVQRRSVVHRLS